MGNKGNSRHIKRLSAPKYFSIGRKEEKFAAKPNPGRHTLHESIALLLVIRDKLGLANNAKEAKSIIHSRMVEINGKVAADARYPVGLSDSLHIKGDEAYYLVKPGLHGSFAIEKASKDSAESMPRKVVGKYLAKNGRKMLRLHDGTSIGAENSDARVNDSVLLSGGKVSKVIKFEKGGSCSVIRGVHALQSGKILEIKPGSSLRSTLIEISGSDGNFETVVENIMMVA